MTDGYASNFPLKSVPDPDDCDPDVLAATIEEMRRTRKGVAPNPLAQALYPTLQPPKPRRKR